MDKRTGSRATRAPSSMPAPHTLSGAYVLDAVSEAERVVFERHLSTCETCARDVAEFRETATRLGLAASVELPPGSRDAVLAAVHRVPQTRPWHGSCARHTRDTATRVLAAVAAVLLAATVTLGSAVRRLQDDQETVQGQLSAMARVLRAEDRLILHEDARYGGIVTVIVSHDRDRAVVLADLPSVSGEHVYQVWLAGEHIRSAGLVASLGSGAFLDVSGLGGADRVVVTVEPSGGSPRPTTPPLVHVALS